MRNKLMLLTITAFLAIGAALLPSRGNALPIGGSVADIRLNADSLNLVQKAQWVYGGRRYCFYLTGWRGPGWYWCGYRWRRGLGWGGVYGWRGWRHPRYHRRFVRPRPGVRPRAGARRPAARPRAGARRPAARPRAGARRPAARPRAGARSRPAARPRSGARSRPAARPRATTGSGRSGRSQKRNRR